jgi:hypothetical protein
VTSRQDGGTHTLVNPEVDATAAGGGITRSIVQGLYLQLRSTNRAGRDLCTTTFNLSVNTLGGRTM